MKNHPVHQLFLAGILAVSVSACGAKEPEPAPVPEPEETVPEEPVITWEEVYDEGIKLLKKEDYKAAAGKFTDAIEIDDSQAPVYVGRGDAYVHLEDITQHLEKALEDYRTAADLDENCAEAYLGMADVYIRRGEFTEAYDLLGSVPAKAAENEAIEDKLSEIQNGTYMDSSNNVRRAEQYDTSGAMVMITEYEFDGNRKTGWTNYTVENGVPALLETCTVTHGDNGLPAKNTYYNADGSLKSSQTMEYDDKGLEIRRNVYDNTDTFVAYYQSYYDDAGNEVKYEGYYADGTLFMVQTNEYDSKGNLVSSNIYDGAGNLTGTKTYSD